MLPEKWQEVKIQIKNVFPDAEFSKEELAEPEKGEKETVLFTGPLGRMKLEYFTRPLVLDKVTHGSRRIGSTPSVEYVYSDTETTSVMKAFKLDEDSDEWVEIDFKESFKL